MKPVAKNLIKVFKTVKSNLDNFAKLYRKVEASELVRPVYRCTVSRKIERLLGEE